MATHAHEAVEPRVGQGYTRKNLAQVLAGRAKVVLLLTKNPQMKVVELARAAGIHASVATQYRAAFLAGGANALNPGTFHNPSWYIKKGQVPPGAEFVAKRSIGSDGRQSQWLPRSPETWPKSYYKKPGRRARKGRATVAFLERAPHVVVPAPKANGVDTTHINAQVLSLYNEMLAQMRSIRDTANLEIRTIGETARGRLAELRTNLQGLRSSFPNVEFPKRTNLGRTKDES